VVIESAQTFHIDFHTPSDETLDRSGQIYKKWVWRHSKKQKTPFSLQNGGVKIIVTRMVMYF